MSSVPLLQVAALVADRVTPFRGTRPYIATGALSDDNELTPEYVIYDARPTRADLQVRMGDVCFARMQATRKVFEFSAEHEDLILSTGFAILRPNPRAIHSGYLRHWLRSKSFQAAKDSHCSGATQKAITNDGIARLSIVLPALAEQRRIAQVLDRTEELVGKRRRALAVSGDLELSLFLDAFEQASGWPTATVAEIACSQPGSVRTGPFGSQLLHSEFTSEGVAVLGIDNVVANEFRWGERRFVSQTKYEKLRRYTVRAGDVLITIMGTCGRCAVVPDDIPLAINTKHLCCITLDREKCLPAYLHAYFLRHPEARRYLERRAKGSIMAGLNMGIISEMPVALPPLSRQIEFERRLGAVRRLNDSLRRSQGGLDALHSALEDQFFTDQT